VVAVITLGFTAGSEVGYRARVDRDGDPTIIITDPRTGAEIGIDPADVAHLTPQELKAYVEYFAAHGEPPPAGTTTVDPYPYLDQFGQWRMSDTGEPVWIEPPEGQFYDTQGELRWTHNGQLVDEEPEPEPASDGAGARDGGGDDDDDRRKFNVTRAESEVWRSFLPYRGITRTNGLQGRAARYYEWDFTHNDIEVYDRNGNHLGSMNPVTGEMYKGPAGHKINL
jgi:hypothetical protein